MSKWQVETDRYVIEFARRLDDGTNKVTPKTRVYVNLGSEDPRDMLGSGQDEDKQHERVITNLYRYMSLAAAYAVIYKLRRWQRSADGVDPETELPDVRVFVPRPSFLEARFSWYAGCSCGCSCGCVLSNTITFDGDPVDVWVTLKSGMKKTEEER